jgi:hypothetical protein
VHAEQRPFLAASSSRLQDEGGIDPGKSGDHPIRTISEKNNREVRVIA